MLHIYINQTKELKGKESETSPKFKITSLGVEKYTKKHASVGTGTEMWNEHIFIEKNGCTKLEIETGKCLIEVLDVHTFKNSVIGLYELDLA